MSAETTHRRRAIPTDGPFVEYSNPKFSLLLSQSGRNLLRESPQVMAQLRKYREDFELRRYQPGNTRTLLEPGNEGIIYTMTPTDIPLAIKEYHLPFPSTHPQLSAASQTAFLKDTLTRAEALQKFCEQHAPDYVKVPDHYGLLYFPLAGEPNAKECLLFMQRVNGIRMDRYTATSSTAANQVRQDWETGLFDSKFPKTANDFSFGPLTTDLRPQNVIVDTSSPTAQRPYTLWLIDQ